MAGIIYLKTDRFEVKLEGITFKAKDFESLCTLDFLFPDGKIWSRPPVVGLDIIRHPRDHNVILLLLCVGVGCLILRFRAGDPLPKPILKFLTDERIRFVGFGIPRKSDIFPYEELGLTRRKNDIGYLAAMKLNDSAYKRTELKYLARKILGIKKMVGLTDASSFERHEHIKCVICQLFITSVIGMALLRSKDKKKLEDSPNMMSFIKSFNAKPLFSEGWLKFPKLKKDNKPSPRIAEKRTMKVRPKESKPHYGGINMNAKPKEKSNVTSLIKRFEDEKIVDDDVDMNATSLELNDGIIRLEKQDNMASFIRDDIDTSDEMKVDEVAKEESTSYEFGSRKCIEDLLSSDEFTFDDLFASPKEIKGVQDGASLNIQGGENESSDDSSKDVSNKVPKKPLKGILRCPSTSRAEQMEMITPISPISSYKEPAKLIKGFLNGSSSSSKVDQMETDSPISSYKEPTTPVVKGILRCPSSSARLEQMEIVSPKPTNKEPTTTTTTTTLAVKGILRCPSTTSNRLEQLETVSPIPTSTPSSLRRANSKGLNVSFAFKL